MTSAAHRELGRHETDIFAGEHPIVGDGPLTRTSSEPHPGHLTALTSRTKIPSDWSSRPLLWLVHRGRVEHPQLIPVLLEEFGDIVRQPLPVVEGHVRELHLGGRELPDRLDGSRRAPCPRNPARRA